MAHNWEREIRDFLTTWMTDFFFLLLSFYRAHTDTNYKQIVVVFQSSSGYISPGAVERVKGAARTVIMMTVNSFESGSATSL